MGAAGFSRRTFLERSGMAAAAAALAQLPALLDAKGLLEEAQAQTADLVRDTFNGVLAFFLPGDDEYSVAQGVSAPGRGAIGGGNLEPFLHAVDSFLPVTTLGAVNTTVPSTGGVAMLLNNYALQVNSNPSHGTFISPFARLSFAEKAEVFRRFEADELEDTLIPELRFVAGILPGFLGFMMSSEVGVFDQANRRLTGTPVAWEISGYGGVFEGHPELIGYYQGRKSVVKPRRKRKRRRKRRRTRARRKRRKT